MTIKTIGIIGAGTMGSGISQVMALSGFEVIMMDIKDEFLQKGMENIKKGLDKMLEKAKITPEQKDAAIAKICTTTRLEDIVKANFVVEAASEVEELKLNIFKQLDKICSKDTILCTNTSSIPIIKIASATKRPDKVIGMHFMNPAPVMKLVEIIKNEKASDETLKTVKDLAEKVGKTSVESKDRPGFIVNRILMPMINEAVFALMEGAASKEDIDTAMVLGTNQPIGPLALADLIGLDTVLSIMESIYKETKDPKHQPCPLLRKYVEEGKLGRKTKKGFYEYNT